MECKNGCCDTKRRQIATVPMHGEFSSGVTRAAVNPVDGQIYTVGLDGWGDYSVEDGCLHRIRYTGAPLLEPIGFKSYDNGIEVQFDIELDATYVQSVKKYYADMWNYYHSGQYGSPEFSVNDPESLGHDPLEITSVQLLADKKSIFVEIPKLRPAMQVHLRMQLKSKSGAEFKCSDNFVTVMYCCPTFQWINVDNIAESPALIKGKGTPITGKKPKTIPTFINI